MWKPVVVAAIGLSLTACSSDTTPTKAPAVSNGAAPTATAPAARSHDDVGVRAMVTALFAPYNSDNPPSVDARPIYTAATRTLIDQWRRIQPEGEVTALGDFDWLCQCQDWDAAQFRVTRQDIDWTGDDTATVTVNYTQMADSRAQLRLMLRREEAAWKIADMEFADEDKPLTARLREEIAEAHGAAGATGATGATGAAR